MPSISGADWRRAVRWGCLGFLSLLATLTIWGSVPAVVGCSSFAVVSGSMVPSLHVGDVLVTCPTSPSDLVAGQVVVFHDPVTGSVVSHRLRSVSADGRLTTRGDANQVDDPGHPTAADVIGTARLRVPWIGLPHVWIAERRWAPLALSAVCLSLATAVLSRPAGGDPASARRPPTDRSPVPREA